MSQRLQYSGVYFEIINIYMNNKAKIFIYEDFATDFSVQSQAKLQKKSTNYSSLLSNILKRDLWNMKFCARDHNFPFHVNMERNILLEETTPRVWFGYVRLG
jgi:hypothetical protein